MCHRLHLIKIFYIIFSVIYAYVCILNHFHIQNLHDFCLCPQDDILKNFNEDELIDNFLLSPSWWCFGNIDLLHIEEE